MFHVSLMVLFFMYFRSFSFQHPDIRMYQKRDVPHSKINVFAPTHVETHFFRKFESFSGCFSLKAQVFFFK